MWPHVLASQSFSLIAIGSALFGAVAIVLARKLLKQLAAKQMLGVGFLVTTIILALFSPLFYEFHASLKTIILVLAVGGIDTAGNYFYFKTLEKTDASIAAPILSLAPFFTFIFAALFLADVVSLKTFLLASAIIVTIIIFSTDRANFKAFRLNSLIPALSSSLLFGLSAVPSKYLLSNLHAINAPTLYMFRAGLITLFTMLIFRIDVRAVSSKQYRTIVSRALAVIAQWILLYTALSRGSAGVSVTLANITPVFVFIIGVLLLHEKPTLKKLVAAILVITLAALI
jgi:drug/metabolite transporter (DMT)-like permease